MKLFAAMALAIALAASTEAVAWKMELVEPGQGQNIIGATRPGRIGGGAGSDSGRDPHRAGAARWRRRSVRG